METKQIDSIIMLDNRKNLKLTGVEKVFYSTQTEALVLTSYGKLHIIGSNICVKKVAIDQNLVELEGKFNTIKYISSDKTTTSKNIFGLFKRG